MNKQESSKQSVAFVAIIKLVCVILLSGQSAAFGFIDALGQGTPLPCLVPRCLALGGVMTVGVDDAYSVFLNPAGIPGFGAEAISLGLNYGGWTETTPVRSTIVPVICRGEDLPFSPFGAVSFGITEELSAAAGCCMVSCFDYTGTNYIYGKPELPEEVTMLQYLNSKGNLHEALAGLSYSLSDNLSIGVSGGMRFGSADINETDNEYTPDSTVITQYDLSWSENQFCWHGGIRAGFGIGNAGLVIASPTDHYPTRTAIGVMILAEHLKNSKIGFECEIISPGKDAEYIGRLMIENPTASFLNTFLGVSFTDGPYFYNPRMGFSMGLEMNFDPVRTQFGYYYRNKSRRGLSDNDQYYEYFKDATTLLSVVVFYML